MSTGAILFSVITFITILDIMTALYLRTLPGRVENGQAVPKNINPDQALMIGNIFLITAPLFWLVVTLISFGVIPTSIDPIKF